MPDLWYFAYGSNLSIERMERRTGQTHERRLAFLDGYRFAFNQRGKDGHTHANIVPSAGSRVWGAIYRCDADALARLDHFEGVADGQYERRTVQVMSDKRTESAVAYIAGVACTGPDGQPTMEYLAHILVGAKEHGLPEEYVQAIERLATCM